MEVLENHESNGPDNSESSVSQEEGEGVIGMRFSDSKDDLFVDASDDLDDARTPDNRESVASNEAETSEEKQDDVKGGNQFVPIDNEGRDDDSHLVAELEHLRHVLYKTVDERDRMEKEFKEERETLMREMTNLRSHLKVLADKEFLPGEHHRGESERKTQMGNTPFLELISECSKLLASALELQSQNESAIRELNAVLHSKDQEIEELNAKITELSVSHDVAASYLNSVAGAASEFQLEKDQYIEVVTDRMLGYLATVVNAGELLDYSISGKISHVENSTYFLIEKYNKMLYEIYQLGQCLSKTEADLGVHEEFGTVFAAARDELLELKRREGELAEKVSHMGQENRKLVEQVEKDKQMVEAVKAELSKTKTELEQEKTRCANTKEKLSMAVTKGKALVQHRDSLKQYLADKTNELEKCLAELQEKSIALQAAELSKAEFVKSNDMVASLQDALLQRNLVLEKSEEILSQIDVPEELQSMDMVERLKWLLNERNELKVLSLDFYRLKDAISLMELPETVSFVDLESRLAWLKESFYQARNDANLLLYELDRTKEVARNEIDRLSASLLAELQEKDYIQKELDDLACKYDEIAQKADKVMLEKDQMMKMLLEESGIIMEHRDGVFQTSSDLNMLVYKCLGRIREQTPSSSHTSSADIEIFERMQSLLYVKNQELMLSEQLLEEDMLQRLELNNLSNKLRVASEELEALKEEKNSMQKDLERSEEKSVLLREKLSMAVKKGKGLVQDRENLKFQLDEKNSEIEKLRLNLQQQESTISECKDQINRLSTDIERIPMLEADIVATKDQRDQLEQLLLERNNVLHRVVESVDCIVLPVDSVFEDPAGKVNWIARYINECQDTKTHLEQEIGKVKEEASALVSKFSEAQATMKSLEDALSVAENKITQLAQEKREIEVVKENVEQELEGAKVEARLQTSKFAAASACRKSLEDELLVAENNISVLVSEKEQAQDSRADAVRELEKVREEFASQTTTLTEAYKTIKSLEDALSRAETTVALLTEQNNVVQVGRSSLEDEMQKLKDEAESHAVKLADAHTAIKSVEDALLKAKNDHSVLEDEKRIADQEISTLNSKLNACMVELAGTSGSLESRSVEIIGQLNNLQMLMKDERLLSVVKQCFQRKIENLQDMDLVIKEITDCVVGKDSELSLNHLDRERNSHMSKLFTNDLDNIEMESSEVMVADTDNISSCFRKTVEVFQMRNKILADKFDSFSVSIDEFIGALLRKLHTTRDEVIRMVQCMESTNKKLKDTEVYKQEHEEAIARLESDVTVLLSACSDATRRLQFEVKNTLLELDSVPELENLNHDFSQEMTELCLDDEAEHQKKLYGNKYVEMAEKLLCSTQKAQTLTKLFERTSAVAASKIQDLQKELNETTKFYEKTKEERDLHQNMVFKLETDVDALKNSYRELSLKVKDCEDIEKQLKEKEAEISSLYNSLSMKEREAEESLLSALQVRTLLNKITGTDIPAAESDAGHLEPESSVHFKKLLNVIYSVTELQHRIKLLTQEKEELGSTISAQSAELEHLKGELQHQVKSLTHEKEELESTISSQSAEIEHLKGELQHQVKSLTHEKEEIESTISAHSAELEHRKGELQQQVKSLTHEKEELESTISALSAEIEHLKREMQCQVKSLTHEKEELESTISAQSTEIEHLKGELQQQVKSLIHEKEELESTISAQSAEIEQLKEVETNISAKADSEMMKAEISQITFGLKKIINILGCDDVDQKSADLVRLLTVLEKQVMILLSEAENSKSNAQEVGTKLLASQKVVDELTTKVKLLEGSIQVKTVEPEIVQERSIFETPSSLPSASEISEVEDSGTRGKKTISPVPSAAHVRTMRKGSTDHLAIDIDSESTRLLSNEETDEDKGHVFKSLNASGLIPKQGKMIADRIDGIWVSGGRVLMGRPRARLGLIAYWLFLHIWLLGTIL